MVNRRKQGKEGEDIALERYLDRQWKLVEQNYTIWGGELDIIVENDEKLIFVEVKVVNRIEDMHDYITRGKMGNIKKTVNRYLVENPTEKEIQIDIIFVQHGKVIEVFENVTIG